MQVVNMSASIQSQSSTRSAQSSSRDGTGGINQPSDVCATARQHRLQVTNQFACMEHRPIRARVQTNKQLNFSHVVTRADFLVLCLFLKKQLKKFDIDNFSGGH